MDLKLVMESSVERVEPASASLCACIEMVRDVVVVEFRRLDMCDYISGLCPKHFGYCRYLILIYEVNEHLSRNRSGKKVANRQWAQFAQLAFKYFQNLSRSSSPALQNADGGTSGINIQAVSPAQSIVSVQPEGGTMQTLKVTVQRARNIPLPKISATRRRRFYVIVTDGNTTHKTSSEKPNANTNTVTWNERIADFHLYSVSSDIMLRLFVEERFGEDTLVGDCSFLSSDAVVTPVEIALELRSVNVEVLRHTTAPPSIHLEVYTTPNVGLPSSSPIPILIITPSHVEHAPVTVASMLNQGTAPSVPSEITHSVLSSSIISEHTVSRSHSVDAFSSPAPAGQINEIYTPATLERPLSLSKADIPTISISSPDTDPTMAIPRHMLDSSNSEKQQLLPDSQAQAGVH
ncbi:hypothetical protein BJ165DRAFT_1516645, partial [Panaeolus papilionaceus]